MSDATEPKPDAPDGADGTAGEPTADTADAGSGSTDADAPSSSPSSATTTSLAASMTDTGRRHTSGSITRAIARSMLTQEKDTRTFGRRGAIIAGLLIVGAAILPVILGTWGMLADTREDARMLYHRGPIGWITLFLLISAGLSAMIVAWRYEGMQRAKGLFWTGVAAFIALIAGRPGGPSDVITASFDGRTIPSGTSLATLALLTALLAWAGILIAARVRLTFEDARTARALGAVSAGLFLIVVLVSETGMRLLAEVLSEPDWPWGLLLVCLGMVPVGLSLVASEITVGAQLLALLTWFTGLGLAIGAAFVAIGVSGVFGALVTFQYIGVFALLIVGSIDWIGQLLFRYRADREAARQLAAIQRTKGSA